MWWIDAARKWALLIGAVALLAFTLPTPSAANATSRGNARDVIGAARSTASWGGRQPIPRASSVSMTMRVTAAGGGRATTQAAGCAATISLAVTLAYNGHNAWSRNDVLMYQPPPGVRVLNAGVPITPQRVPSLSRHRLIAAHPAVPAGGAPVARFTLTRARHGRTTVTLKLALRASLLRIRDRRGHRQGVVGAVVGGARRVLRGQTTLSRATLYLFTPITCTTVRSHGGHRDRGRGP